MGFNHPPSRTVLPRLRDNTPRDLSEQFKAEQPTLDILNRWLAANHRPLLRRLGDLYTQVDAAPLLTFPELDHFGPRPGARYFGILPSAPGIAPQWPQGAGPRVFAYLKPFPALPALGSAHE